MYSCLVKILHTSDWHMNETLGRVDRSGDICRSLERIARYLDEREVDVMLATGDLFSERSRPEQMRAAVGKIKEIFLPFLERGGSIVAISGNHDNEVFFATLRDALDLAAPAREGRPGSGRFHIASDPEIVRLAGEEGDVVQFVLMPYPTARAYLRGADAAYRTVEEKHRAIQEAFTKQLYAFMMRLDPKLPVVLASHVHVRGVSVHTLYRISESEDVVFDPGNIPTNWAYVAYGHIHKGQALSAGAEHVRYAGSVERMDVAERDDEKSVVLVEVTPNGLAGPPELLPLEPTPIYAVEIRDPAEIAGLAEQYPDPERALVAYTLHWEPGVHDRDALARAVQEVFPRWYSRRFKRVGHDPAEEESAAGVSTVHDVAGNVRDYVGANAAPEHRDELLRLAEALLAEESAR
jgi:exonuclease SbcD